MSREVVVVSGVRTAIGTYGGSLKDIPPTELAAQVVQQRHILRPARRQHHGAGGANAAHAGELGNAKRGAFVHRKVIGAHHHALQVLHLKGHHWAFQKPGWA